MYKKFVSLVLVFALALSSLCAFAAPEAAVGTNFSYAALKARAVTSTNAIPVGVPFIPEYEITSNGDGTFTRSLVGGRIVSESELNALALDSAVPYAIGCPNCLCTGVKILPTTTIIEEVGTSDCCYKTHRVRPLECSACGYPLGHDILSTTSHGHSFVLNPEGVFMTCSRCRCVTKA